LWMDEVKCRQDDEMTVSEKIMVYEKSLLRRIRAEFPRAVSDARGRRRAFMDNGTGTLVAKRAARAEAAARVDCSANVEATFNESKDAEATILEGKKAVADLLNAPSPDTIASGESATSLFFSLSYAMARDFAGNENVVTTDYEHYANISPWIELEKRGVIREVRFARLNKTDGTLDLDHLKSLVDNNTKVVTVTAASNALGTKTRLDEVRKIARAANAYFVVDAVHHIAHGPMDVQDIGCDFLVFSGYKIFSSHGSFLYGKEDLLKTLRPYKVAPATSKPPNNWEWGTRDQAMFAAIGGVGDHLVWLAQRVHAKYGRSVKGYSGRARSLKVALRAIEEYGRELSKAILEGQGHAPGLLQMQHVKLYGIAEPSRVEERDPTFSFKLENMPDQRAVEHLWTKHRIALRADNFYSRVPEVYDVPTMIRISLVHYNTPEEVEMLLKGLDELDKL
jgi:selenocysteine lyase/cysteine desulfurase